jgi:ABC-type sugar transport system permease subunit
VISPRLRTVLGWGYLLPYAVLFVLFVLVPIGVAAYLAVMQFDLTAPGSAGFVGLRNFVDAWNDEYVHRAFAVTAKFAAMMVPSLVVVAFSLAVGLNAMPRGRNLVRAMVFLPTMFTVAVTGILWQWFYNLEFGLFNFILRNLGLAPVPWLSDKNIAMPSIVLMSLWWTSGGTAVILLAGLQNIPRMFHEAASLDGADGWRGFWSVTIPLLRPVVLFVIVTNLIGAFQFFPQAQLLTGGGPELATRGVVQYIYETAFNGYRLGYAAAISWMLAAVVAVFGFLQFWLMRKEAS